MVLIHWRVIIAITLLQRNGGAIESQLDATETHIFGISSKVVAERIQCHASPWPKCPNTIVTEDLQWITPHVIVVP